MNEANSVACEIMQLDLAIFSVSISYTENHTKRRDVKPVYFDQYLFVRTQLNKLGFNYINSDLLLGGTMLAKWHVA